MDLQGNTVTFEDIFNLDDEELLKNLSNIVEDVKGL